MGNKWCILFVILALLCSYITCFAVGYHWGRFEYAILYKGYSAPNYVALFYGVPYFIVTLACVTIAVLLRKRKPLPADNKRNTHAELKQ